MQVVQGLGFGVVVEHPKRLGARGDARKHLAHLARFGTVILVDESQVHIFDFSAKGVAQHDELQQWENH